VSRASPPWLKAAVVGLRRDGRPATGVACPYGQIAWSPLRQSGAKCWAGTAACVLVEFRITPEALGLTFEFRLYAYTPRSSCTAATRLIASMYAAVRMLTWLVRESSSTSRKLRTIVASRRSFTTSSVHA
jgi:hypothetical protein